MKKRLIALFLVLMMISLAVAGCADDAPAEDDADRPLRIGYTVMGLANPYFVALSSGVEARGAELGWEVTIHDGQMDAARQIEGIENFIAMQKDAILITPFDGAALTAVTERAREEGIILINLNQEYDGPWDAFLTIPEYEFGLVIGQEAGRWIRDKKDGEADVMVLDAPMLEAVIARAEGIVDGILQYAPNANIVAQQGAIEPDAGMRAAEATLIAQPNLSVIVGVNDGGALGAYEAVMAANRATDTFFVGGLDATPEALEKIREGGIYRATVDIDPFGTGKLAVDTVAAVRAHGHQGVIVIPMNIVNASNIERFFN